jgi:two-component system, sensor histidine kinase and response regulator
LVLTGNFQISEGISESVLMAPPQPASILLIGDNRSDFVTIRHLLVDERRGEFTVTWARSLSDGLEHANANSYDAIFFDLTTAVGQSQRQFMEYWTQLTVHPVIVLCPAESESAAIDAVRKGAQDYLLHAHIDKERLSRSINLALTQTALRNERKEKDALLKKMDRNRLKDDFVGILANEAWLPLLGARLVLEHLLDGSLGELNDQQSVAVGQLKKGNEELLSVTQELLDIYTHDTSKVPPTTSDIDIREMIELCIKDSEQITKFRNITVTAEFPQDLPLIKGDSSALRRVFINLLENAVNFSPNKQSVAINVALFPEAVTVSITDKHRDILEEDQQAILHRFWMGEAGRRYSNKCGMHLYLCQRIVDAHGGKINVLSKPKVGTTFTVSLPR